ASKGYREHLCCGCDFTYVRQFRPSFALAACGIVQLSSEFFQHFRSATVTVDEELSLLEESVRRLKIEYDVYFGGGAKKPPADTEWRVQSLVKKFSDGHRLSFAQRFKYNSIVQKYSLFNALWQQKLKIKEEGYRRPQDARLGIA